MEWLIAILLLIVILGFAYWKNSLTLSATIFAFGMGIIIFYASGFPFLITLLTFFISNVFSGFIGIIFCIIIYMTFFNDSYTRII